MSLELPDKIEAKISPEPNSGCWLWLDPLRDGYGRFFDGKQHRSAHRVVYELLCKKIEPGLTLDHLCRVRCCVNPDHLEPVTQKENIRRGLTGKYQRVLSPSCPEGHEFTAANTYLRKSGTRYCRQCHRERNMAAHNARKQK